MSSMSVLTREPHGMRPARARYWNGYIGEYLLADGRVVWSTWLPYNRTHVHILVWDEEQTWEVRNVCRLQAAAETDRLLTEIES